MGSSSSKLKSRPSKLFKRASFRRGSKKKKEKQQASSNGAVHLSSNGTAVQNGSHTNDVTVLSNGNGNNNITPAVHLQPSDQQQVAEPSLSPSPSPSPSPSSPSPQPPSSPSLSPSPSSSPSPHPEIIESTPSPQPPPSPECSSSPQFKNGHNHRENNAYSTLNLPTTSTSKLQRSSKRKSRSIGHLLRRSASMKGGNSSSTAASPSPDNTDARALNDETAEKSKSTFSLSKRFSSLKSIGSFRRFRRSRSARQLQTELAKAETEELAALEALFKSNPAEVPPPGEECYFSRLYEAKLHQKVFRYFSLPERITFRAVCKRWQIELLKEAPTFVYPLFTVPQRSSSEPEAEASVDHHWEAQQATSASNRYLYYASNVQRLAVKGRLTRGTLESLVKYCFSKRLTSVEFRADPESGNEKCDIISTSVLEAFSAKFGPQLEEVTVTTSSKHLSFLSKNNDLTGN